MHFHKWNYDCEIWRYLISLELELAIFEKIKWNNGDLKIYEYIYHKIIYITKYEKNLIHFKSGVTSDILGDERYRYKLLNFIDIDKFIKFSLWM